MQIPEHKIEEAMLFIKWRDIQIEPGSIEQAHRHNYFQFMFLETAKGLHEIDFTTYKGQNKSLHFVGKGCVHKVAFDPSVKGGVFLFPEELFGLSETDSKLLASLKYFKSDSCPILKLSTSDFLIIEKMIGALKNSIKLNPIEISKYLLFALLAKVREIYISSLDTTQTSLDTLPMDIVRYNTLLQKKGKEWNTIEPFVNELGLTAARLNQLCKKLYGKTALQRLHNRKLLAAKRMLVYTDKQVKEIAYDCGFEDVAYFNRFFKKNVFCTPITFRKNHLNPIVP